MPSVSKLIMTEVEMEGQARPKTPISATHNGRRKQARLKSTSLPTPSARYVCVCILEFSSKLNHVEVSPYCYLVTIISWLQRIEVWLHASHTSVALEIQTLKPITSLMYCMKVDMLMSSRFKSFGQFCLHFHACMKSLPMGPKKSKIQHIIILSNVSNLFVDGDRTS